MGLEWLAGVALSLGGNVLNNLGTNWMKLGHNNGMQSPLPHAAYKERAWQAGLVLYAVGTVAMFYSFGYAAQSLLAAIGCIQFVSNVVFASWVLKEQVTHRILCATGLVVIGCVLLVVFGSRRSESLDVPQLLELYKNPAYITYLAVGTVAAAASFALYWFGNKALKAKQTKHVSCWAAALPVLFSLFSALICTQSLVFNKAVMVLWRLTLAGDNQFNKWETWVMAVAFLLTSGLWVVQINNGLRVFPALIIVPCLQLCWTLFGVVCGLLYFQEYRGMTGLQVAMFVLGVCVVCVGAAMLASTPRAGDSAAAAAAAAHEHAEAEVVLTPLHPLTGKCASSLAGAADGISCQVVMWPDSRAQSTSGALLQPAGHSMPLIFSYVPPAAAAETGLLPPQGSLDAGQPQHMTRTRGGNRRMSRLRTVSMPT